MKNLMSFFLFGGIEDERAAVKQRGDPEWILVGHHNTITAGEFSMMCLGKYATFWYL